MERSARLETWPTALLLLLNVLTACSNGKPQACPAGPQAPLGEPCSADELTCRYGYDPPECGGRTVVCKDMRWIELEHTDPQRSCFEQDAAPEDASLSDASTLDASRDDASALDASGDDASALDASTQDASTLDASGGDADDVCVPTQATGGGCTYVRIPGSATVTALELPAASAYSCKNDPVAVRFSFQPDDPRQMRCFGELDWEMRLQIGAGANPPRACIEASGIAVGTTLRATRQDIVSGPCTPVVFAFDEALVSDCISRCVF